MKILMLTPYLPYPPSSGGQIRSFNLIKYLSRKHEITLFSLIKENKEKKYISELNKYCKKVFVFKRSKTPWTARNILLAGFGPYPFLVIRNLAPKQKKAIRHELESNKYDLIHAETFYVMPHLPTTNVPILLVEQTIEYLVYKHYISMGNPILKPAFSIDVAKLKYWETKFWKAADRVVAVSQSDKREMLKLAPRLEVDLVPNGVNLDFFKVKKFWNTKNAKVLFVANFTWLQNIEAAEILITKLFPYILQSNPNCTLQIVGQHIPESVLSRNKKNVKIINLKDDDEKAIRNAYYNASVFVSPLRGPGGTRLKHLAAMASKLPLVTTKVGAEGLGAQSGVHLVVSDSIQDMAMGAVKILNDKVFAKKLAENARTLVETKYSWERMSKYLDKVYEKTANKK